MTRPHLRLSLLLALLATLALPTALAQNVMLGTSPNSKTKDEPPPPPGGIVTGRVIFADTNGPARFAKVLLKSTTPSSADDENPFAALLGGVTPPTPPGSKAVAVPKPSAADEAEKKQAEAASAKVMSSISDLLVSTTIGADGTYTFTNVKAGTYYVHAMAPGYIDPLSQFSSDELTSTDPAIKQKIAAANLVTVHVVGTDSARADLRLQRGASISGRVLYDDGTPAVGWTVRTVHDPAPNSTSATPAAFASMGVDMADLDLSHIAEATQTNDTGSFRIAGLPAGDYVLQARFTAPALGHSSFNALGGAAMAQLQGIKLTVYSGNATRRADAKSISLGSGEDRNSYDITMPLHATHTIAGLVRAKADGHPINSGTVELTLQDAQGNPDPSVHLAASIDSDGSFRFDYIPSGTYTLKTSKAADVTVLGVKKMFGSTIADTKTNHTYGPATATTTLADGDITDVKLDVPELPAP